MSLSLLLTHSFAISLYFISRDGKIVKTFSGLIYIYILKYVIYRVQQYSRRYYLRANVSSFHRVRTRRIIISESNEPSNGPPLSPRALGVLHVGHIHIFFPSKIIIIAPCPGTLKGRVERKKLQIKKNKILGDTRNPKSSKTSKLKRASQRRAHPLLLIVYSEYS